MKFEVIFTPDQGDALANTHSVFPALIGIGLIFPRNKSSIRQGPSVYEKLTGGKCPLFP